MINADDILEATSTVKVLAFMEVEPLTDKFQQIVLSEAQAKAMRDALFHILSPQADMEQEQSVFNVITNDKVEVVLPDVLDAYGDKYIKENQEVEG